MPVPNDLTPEEEQEFAQHGVPSAGQGREPLADEGQQQQPPGSEAQTGQEQEGQHQPARDTRGRFAPQGQGQEQQDQQGQQQEGQQQEGQQQGQEGQQQEPKFVPLEALHAERARVREMARNMQTLQARTNMLLQQRQPAEQQTEMPDMAEDPAGYIKALEERVARFEQGWQADRETQQIDTNLNNDEALFAVQQPDYNNASDYYVKSRAAELLTFYPPEQAQQMLFKEAREIARQSWARGRSAAETIYGLAMARGYNPNAPSHQQQGQDQQQQRQTSARDVVDGVRNGQQQAGRSLSGGAGGSRTGTLNAEALLSMSDEEFEQTLALGSKGANSRFAAIGG